MATTKPTYQNSTTIPINIPRFNKDSMDVPVGKYVTGDFWATNNTKNGLDTGVAMWKYLGFTDVSSGSDPSAALIVYDYTLANYVTKTHAV